MGLACGGSGERQLAGEGRAAEALELRACRPRGVVMPSSMVLMRLLPSCPSDLISVGVTSAGWRAAPSGAVRRRLFSDAGDGRPVGRQQSGPDRSSRRAARALWLPGNGPKEEAVAEAKGVEGRLAEPVSGAKAVVMEDGARGGGSAAVAGGRFSLKSPCSVLGSWIAGALAPKALAGWLDSSVRGVLLGASA